LQPESGGAGRHGWLIPDFTIDGHAAGIYNQNMEGLLVIGGIWLLFWVIPGVFRLLRSWALNASTQNTSSSSSSPRPAAHYRPKPARTPKIKFKPSIPAFSSATSLRGLRDAFTGAPLTPARGLHQCTVCSACYHSESAAALRESNASRCVACGSRSIVACDAAIAGARGTWV
jgi:hypothetical protein